MYIWDIIYIYNTWESLVRGCKPVPTTGMLTEIAQVAYNSLLHSLRQCGTLGDHDPAFHGAGAADALDQRRLWSVAIISMTL